MLHSGSKVFEADVRGLIDEMENPELLHRSPGKRSVQEVTDAIFLVPGNRQAATHRANAR
jgi:hypothetical protein